ncbi:MAG: PT domain-containing protein [Acidimicrobiia bacterium]|nr:PT domain-containing protein [Acidimicrobiia bacterium]
MKRALIVALTVALFGTLFAGMAAAQSSVDLKPAQSDIRPDAGEDSADIGHILRRCRHLFGEDELTDSLKERCLELWKRWCSAHPDARYCRRPDVRPHDCRVTDRVIDRRCHPDRPTDRPVDRPAVRPADVPADRPVVRPSDAPSDRPTDKRPTDQRPTDRTRNDVHLRLRSADL